VSVHDFIHVFDPHAEQHEPKQKIRAILLGFLLLDITMGLATQQFL